MSYILEASGEFERLEVQSAIPQYNFVEELRDFHPVPGHQVLDAGSGSGVVARHLARSFPAVRVVAVDISARRVELARAASVGLANLVHEHQDLRQLGYCDDSFDGAISRYVFQHLSDADQARVASELWRVLQPGARLCLIDVDGMGNLFPSTPLVRVGIDRLTRSRFIDMHVGRKLPSLLIATGFVDIEWRIIPMCFAGAAMETEIAQYQSRFSQAGAAFNAVFASTEQGRQFIDEFYACLRSEGAVLYYNKFVVMARKPTSK
jgi:SAM-dependent methyltransferase